MSLLQVSLRSAVRRLRAEADVERGKAHAVVAAVSGQAEEVGLRQAGRQHFHKRPCLCVFRWAVSLGRLWLCVPMTFVCPVHEYTGH